MSRIPTNSLNHMYYEASCIEYTHFEVQQVIPRSEWCVCGATSLRWRGEGSCSLARSCLDPDGGGGGYLLNMPRPVWQPSHYKRPVISLKLLHSKWLSRVRVICLSTGELEGGEILTHFCLFLNSIWGCWWWYWIKGRFLVPGRTICPTSAQQPPLSWPRGAPHFEFSEKVRSLFQPAGLMAS